ncbi:hypothetical protein, partial [Salmonella enterica]|uniref:hypothetical protein n=1 Tax=Salmonella enterica TaxID=28901 RepID=UPI003D2A2944
TLLTSLGNPGLLLALSAAVAVALLLAGRACGRVAALWLGAVGACFVLVSTLKICLISCGQLWLPGIDLQSPSGHAAGSMVVYGGLAVLLRTQMPG